VESRYPPPPAGIHPDSSLGWIRRLTPLLRAQRARIGVSLVAALLAMLVQVAIPWTTMRGVDRALDSRQDVLWPYVVALIALGVVRAVMTFGYRFGLYGMTYRLEAQLRNLTYEHLTRLSFSFYDRVQSGQIISRANTDIRSVQMFLTFAPIVLVQVLSLFVALVLMLVIDVRLTIVAVAALPFVYVLAQRLRDVVFPVSWLIQGRMAEVATVVDENVNGVRVVKAFAAEEREIGRLARAAQRLWWVNVTQNDARARYNPIIENLPRLSLALVLAYGGWLATDGTVSVGALIAFSQYVLLMAAPFRFVGFVLMLGQRAKASAERIFEVLDEPVEVRDRPGAVDLVDPRGEIRFEHVRFGYRDEPILDDFDLLVPAGQTVAIVGATGSGKSTVPRLLLRFYDVDDGRVLVDGRDVRDLTMTSLRHAVSIVPDEPFLFSASVHDNIAFGRPDATRAEVEEAARSANADEFVQRLGHGYDTVIGERGYDLSGGQRQRLSIARELVTDPAVLVLDDATSAIDVNVEEEIHDAIRRLAATRTTIVIAHRLSTIGLADRVVLIEDGRIVADGTHQQLLATEPRYARVLASAEEQAGVRR
jgi:ATP-binding cassette, subfamily B, bacterial